MKFKKAFAAVAMSAFIALSLCGLVGCADNSKQVITDSLTEEIESLKNPDAEMIAEMSSEVPANTFEQLGLNSDDVVRALFEGFDGTVDSVEVNGKNAEAVVTLSSKDFSQIEDVMTEVTDELSNNVEQFSGMSQSEIMAWVGQQLMEKINAMPVVTHDPITIEYVLNGNTWEPTEDAETAVFKALF